MVLEAVSDVGFGGFVEPVIDEDVFNAVLDLFDGGCVRVALGELVDAKIAEFFCEGSVSAVGGFEGFENGVGDLELIKIN